jgi:hypothetical protein
VNIGGAGVNSKQRVQAALQCRFPDRIPYGEYAIDVDVAERILGHETYLRAKAKSKIAFWEGRRDEVVQSWKEDIVALYSKLDCIDIVNLASEACGIAPPKDYLPEAPKRISHDLWEDRFGNIYQYSDITKDITIVQWGQQDIYLHDGPQGKPDDSIFEVIDYVIEKMGTDKFIIGPAGREAAMFLQGGMECGLMEYYLNPDRVKQFGEEEVELGNMEDHYYIRPGVDGIMWGQDFAYASGPFISPPMFRRFVVDNCKARVQNIKKHFGLPVIKHACGNNWKLMDMFTEIGYDCYQGIQASASMDLEKLKVEYGDSLCLWGGYNLETLTSGSREELQVEIENAIEIGKRFGGFILGSSHSVAVGSNYDNFMTVLEYVSKLN